MSDAAKIDDHADCVKAVVMLAGIVDQYDMAGAVERAQRALAVGPLLDPTLWREKHAALEQDIETLRAALPLVALAKRLKEGVANG